MAGGERAEWSREVESSQSSIQHNPGLGRAQWEGDNTLPSRNSWSPPALKPVVLHSPAPQQLAMPPIPTAQFYRDVREAVAQA